MTFQPVLPLTGYSGWLFLNRTLEAQQQAFDNSSSIQRDVSYFQENISSISTAEELVQDRRLMSVALGAFGLDEDINNKYFVQKVLSDGVVDDGALANRLSDKRYYEMSKAFGFGFETPNTVLSDFSENIVGLYKEKQFEKAVGGQDDTMRLALNLDRGLSEIAVKETSDDGRWYSVMGDQPIRAVFETAFGLPSSFAALDLDQQLSEFRERADQFFGSSEVSQFESSEKREELVRLFMVRSEINANSIAVSSASNALTLLASR